MLKKITKNSLTANLILGLCFLTVFKGNAQVSNYLFSQTNAAYTEITGGTVIKTGDCTNKDTVYTANLLGFTFQFNGKDYTEVGVSTEGYIWFGRGTPATNTYSPISAASANLNGTDTIEGVAAALARHLAARTTAPCGEIMCATAGTSGSQVFTVQYKNFKTSSATATAVVLNFQIKLYEGSNAIEFAYGPFTTTGLSATSACQVGLRGISNLDFINRTTTTSWDSTTAGTAANASMRLSPTVFADSDLVYHWAPSAACSGTPTAGQAFIAQDSICPGTLAHFTLTGATAAMGITYQWQVSNNGSTWSNMNGAINSNLNDSIYLPVYVQCLVSCGSNTTASSPVQIFINPFNECYCTPASTNSNCTNGGYIDSVAIMGTSINNVSACDQLNGTAYSVFPVSASTSDTLFLGVTYMAHVKTTASNKISLWIDYDHSGSFDASEWTLIDSASVAGMPSMKNFSIPLTAQEGLTKMRIRTRSATGANAATNACTQFGSGETEDYTIIISSSPNGINAVSDLKNGMEVYPNPFTGDVNISYSLSVNVKSMDLAIYNAYGQLVKVLNKGSQSAGKFNVNFAGNEMCKGIYIVKLIADGNISTKRIVKN